jgi:hypothetical protein
MRFDERGLVFGRNVLAVFRDGELQCDARALMVKLTFPWGRPLPPLAIGCIRRAAKHYMQGNTQLSDVTLAMTGVPKLQNTDQVEMLDVACQLMDDGVDPLELLRCMGIEELLDDVRFREFYRFLGGDLRKAGFNEDDLWGSPSGTMHS